MALNEYERDVINALILRVDDLTFEVKRLQGQGHKMLSSIPFAWLRRRFGLEMWPMLYEYPDLRLFVDTAPEVPNPDNLAEMVKKGSPRDNRGNSRLNIPGYYECSDGVEALFTDSGDDTGS